MKTFILIAGLLLVAQAHGQVNTWDCTHMGNTTTCSGYQNGRFVTCTTTRNGSQSSTNCF